MHFGNDGWLHDVELDTAGRLVDNARQMRDLCLRYSTQPGRIQQMTPRIIVQISR